MCSIAPGVDSGAFFFRRLKTGRGQGGLMKVSHKSVVWLLGIILVCVVSGIAMLLFGLLRTAIPHLHKMFTGEIPFDVTHDAVLFATAMLILLLALIPAAFFFWYWRYQVVAPLHRAEDFLERLSLGETPPPLPTGGLANHRIQTLFSELNLLSDRLRSLSARLEKSIAHEAELRDDLEKYDRMQIELMARLLPETRRSIGVVKGLLLGSMDCTDEAERRELGVRAFHRITSLSREIERLIDFSRLGLARWNAPRQDVFDTAVFMRELVNRSKTHLQARNISFESGVSGRPPVRLKLDRELLYQLLSIMIRAVGRLSVSGSAVKFVCRGDGRNAGFEVSCPVCERMEGDLAAKLSEAAAGGVSTAEDIPVEVLALGVVREISRRLHCVLHVRPLSGGADLVMELPPEACVFEQDKLEFSSFEEYGGSPPAERRRAKAGALRRNVLLWSDDPDESLAISSVLRQSGIFVRCFSSLDKLEGELDSSGCDGLILSPRSFGIDPCELVFRLRKRAERPNLAITVLSPQMSDQIYRKLGDLDRVTVLIMPINYEMLAAAFGG